MLRLRKLLLVYIIFIVFGCTKTASKPTATTTPEYSETTTHEYSETQESTITQESTDIENWWKKDDFWDKAKDPQNANKMLVDYLEKQDKTISRLGLISTRAGNFTDFTPLLAFKDLETLDIDNFLITDISGITVLSQHEKLSKLILWAENVTDIKPLSALVNLRSLSIDVANTYTDASELLPLVNLEGLAFAPASSETINNISKLIWLKRLYLNLNEYLDISPIQNLKNLERLEIDGPLYEGIDFNISWISQLSKLKELELSRFNITDVNPLLKLPNIKKINVMWSAISDENIALLKKTGAVVYTHADADR